MNIKIKQSDEFWKHKLMAYLHDPPCKPMDLSHRHEEIAWQFCKSENISDDEKKIFHSIKDADYMASATDRMSFKRGSCSNRFSGQTEETFKHPLSGDEFIIEPLPATVERAEELLSLAVGGIQGTWKQKFFLYWRRWMEEVVKLDKTVTNGFPYFPAETRLPDHSIWNHISLTSALQGCRNENQEIKPAFLIFNLGPVQEFIAQARSTRDLWSGSYMLAWLTAHAMKIVSDFNGPDSIIFPSLRGQGIFDILCKEELYDQTKYKEDTLWKRMYKDGDFEQKKANAKILLNPTLPNRFLALLPEDKAEEIAKLAEETVRCELRNISEKGFEIFAEIAGEKAENWKERWDKQVECFPQISWTIMPWEHDKAKALEKFKKLPINQKWKDNPENKGLSPYENLKQVIELSEKAGYNDDGKPVNAGSLWAANYALAEYAMSARRNCREFEQFITDSNQKGCVKDALSGKEEVIGDEEFWKTQTLFKENEGPYGAINIIKRLWVKNYLLPRLDISEKVFFAVNSFESVPDVAAKNKDGSPYVAVIAMDGDEMGKWISGAKNPLLAEQICENAREFLGEDALKDVKRPMSAAFHLQFSETLANFANLLAGRIVEHYQGQLIYAGGDDVLAMLPADKAIKCARALRAVFRGKKDDLPEELNSFQFHIPQDGFVSEDKGYALMVPGPKSDVSCGIAIGHMNHPLQHLVQEAQQAEKRAKNEYGRAAFAVSLMKRGGEIIHWGAKWEHSAITLYAKYCEYRNNFKESKKSGKDSISSRFPYALAGFLKPYNLGEPLKDIELSEAVEIIETELKHVMEQQGGKELLGLCNSYLNELKDKENFKNPCLADFAKLFLTVAFIERERGE